VCMGAVTFDQAVGFNNFRGQITHHIGGDAGAITTIPMARLNLQSLPEAAIKNSPPVELLPSALVSYKDMIWAAAKGQRGR
jgi:hypothetical protein